MQIRKYKIDDAVELAKLARATIRTVNAKDHIEPIITAWSKGNTAAIYRKTEQERIRFVAVVDKKIIGFTDMLPDGDLTSLYVHPDFIGKGVGKQLLAYIENIARKKRIKIMYCQSSVNAKKFYEKHGYKVIKPDYWIVKGVPPMQVYKMEKKI